MLHLNVYIIYFHKANKPILYSTLAIQNIYIFFLIEIRSQQVLYYRDANSLYFIKDPLLLLVARKVKKLLFGL